jgi:hypothetical protein
VTRDFVISAGLAGAFLLSACGPTTPVAYGDAHALIVAAPAELWAQVGDTVEAALEPRIRTVRAERTMTITHAPPGSTEWRELRRWRRVLVVGEAGDPWVQPVVARAGQPEQLPALLEAENIWARGEQRVFALVLPPGGGAAEVQQLLPALHERVDTRFRQYAVERMFASGRNLELWEQLGHEAGFQLLLPQVYRTERLDSAYVFSNVYRADSDIVRVVLVSWRDGAVPLSREAIVSWRDSWLDRYGNYRQETVPEHTTGRPIAHEGAPAFEVQGTWQRPPGEWPAAGPFITRVVQCAEQNRSYLLDAWLFAPGRAKYEYMIQLEQILNSFRCADGAARTAA